MYKISLQNLRMMMLDRVESVEKDEYSDGKQEPGDKNGTKRNGVHILDYIAQRGNGRKNSNI